MTDTTDMTAATPILVGVEPPPMPADVPRSTPAFSATDRIEFAVAAASGLSASLALCLIMDWTHPLTFLIWSAIGVLTVEWLLVRDRAGSVVASDRLMTVAVWSAGAVAVGLLAWMLIYVVAKGAPGISWSFFTQDMSKVGPLDPGGGVFHAIIGTLEQTALASAFAVPVAVLTAVYLHELRGPIAPVVRFVSDAMSGLPSIVAGLLVYTLWVHSHGFSGAAGSAALAVVMLPIVTRTAEEVLRTVDQGLRESALAMGAPQWRTVLQVVLPTVRSGLVTAAILGFARASGETAPLLLTAFGSSSTNYNPFSGPQSNLPLYVFQLIKQPNARQLERAWAGALVLIALVLILFTAARVISARGAKRLGAKR